MSEQQRLRVGFLTPYFHEVRGNATTAKRIVTGLQQLGIDVVIYPYEEEEFSKEIDEQLKTCDLLHVLHFYRFATWSANHSFKLVKPYVITSGGTDINHDLFDDSKKQLMKNIIENASAITVFSSDGKEKVEKAFPMQKGNISVIPQSVWFPNYKSEHKVNVPIGYPNLLLPAGLRPVKDVLFVMENIIKLKVGFPNLQFTIVGTVLDDNVHKQVQEVVERYPWVRFINDVPLAKMPSYYNWADAVLNTSISEGQSSAILEGMYFEKVIFARKNEGNVSIVTDNENGFLYDSPVAFQEKFRHVFSSADKGKQISLHGKRYVEKHHNHKEEIKKYLHLYEKLT
jgi:glycosyltransferase involved in cell wall biosynthesis